MGNLGFTEAIKRHPLEYLQVKRAYSGSLGSGATSGQSTIPPRLVDASGATPAGPENQPASASKILLDNCFKEPDPAVFDLAKLEKQAFAPFEDMEAGTEQTQEALDTAGVQWTGRARHQTVSPTSPKEQIRNILPEDSSYQPSGTSEAGGRVFEPSSAGAPLPMTSVGLSAPTVAKPNEDEEVKMELDSTTAETGQKPHLSA